MYGFDSSNPYVYKKLNLMDPIKLKEKYFLDRDRVFNDPELLKDPFKFCITYSILVEEYIIKVLKGIKLNCAITSVGSFSRRELSPYSDIDIMFIFDTVEGNEDLIKDCVTRLWDAGIEVSHTVREYSDIEKFLHSDLHAFTQFVETRFIHGRAKIYNEWNKKVFKPLNEEHKKELILEFFEDVRMRYQKFGDSAKVLEPVSYTHLTLPTIYSV
jgi:[protein-PII] uridylyltransferase